MTRPIQPSTLGGYFHIKISQRDINSCAIFILAEKVKSRPILRVTPIWNLPTLLIPSPHHVYMYVSLHRNHISIQHQINQSTHYSNYQQPTTFLTSLAFHPMPFHPIPNPEAGSILQYLPPRPFNSTPISAHPYYLYHQPQLYSSHTHKHTHTPFTNITSSLSPLLSPSR